MKFLTGKDKTHFELIRKRRDAFYEVKWYVIRTWSGYEQKVAKLFRDFGIEVFCPVVHYGWSTDSQAIELLCPNMIFVHLSVDTLHSIMRHFEGQRYMSPGIDRTRPQDIGWMQYMKVPDYEMNLFMMLVTEYLGMCYSPQRMFLYIGDKVSISSGFWAGQSGIVQDINVEERLVLVEGDIDKTIHYSARVPFESLTKVISITNE